MFGPRALGPGTAEGISGDVERGRGLPMRGRTGPILTMTIISKVGRPTKAIGIMKTTATTTIMTIITAATTGSRFMRRSHPIRDRELKAAQAHEFKGHAHAFKSPERPY